MARYVTLLALFTLALPVTANACAVCFSGTDESRLAFILTTGLLTFLPLGMIGGAIYWAHRKAKRRATVAGLAKVLPGRV